MRMALGTLVGARPFMASYTEYESQEPPKDGPFWPEPVPATIWRVWAVTADTLANVSAMYDRSGYQLSEEDLIDKLDDRPQPSPINAWIRPLKSVLSFNFSDLSYDHTFEKFHIGHIGLTFTDGFSCDIDGHSGQRWDNFVDVIRQQILTKVWPGDG